MEKHLKEHILKNQEEFGKKVVEYCKPYTGFAYYSIVMKAIEFGYQLGQEEDTIKPIQEEKTSWNREEIIQLLTKFLKNYLGKIPNWLQRQIDEWIEENL